jgi:signal transduction histidine kinase
VTGPAESGDATTRRRWRRPGGIRVRLTLIYTSVFLVGGVILLGLTFILVSNSLGSSGGTTATSPPSRALLAECKAKANGPHRGGKENKVSGKDLSVQCQKAFEAGSVAGKNAQRNHTMHELELWSLVGLAALTLGAAGLGWAMAGRALRPVREITDAARRASERHLGERINLSGPEDELKELADTFDDMLDRLDSAFATQRRFVANASHELRTPLTTMRTAIDVVLAKPDRTTQLLDATLERVRRSTGRAEHIIDALLTMAVSNQGVESVEPVDLATAAEDALDEVRDQVQQSGLRLETALDEARVDGSQVLLERMVANLVENAVTHNVPQGWVRVRTWSEDDSAILAVANSGPRVSADELPGLFEPFRRAASRTGSSGVGLGLSIVRAVGDAHGAAIEACAERDGGLLVTVTIPLSRNLAGV